MSDRVQTLLAAMRIGARVYLSSAERDRKAQFREGQYPWLLDGADGKVMITLDTDDMLELCKQETISVWGRHVHEDLYQKLMTFDAWNRARD